jgi:hypothetical protein
MKGKTMPVTRRFFTFALTVAFCSAAATTGCKSETVYHDTVTNESHPRSTEEPIYRQWESNTHREHVDLEKRNSDEQKQYWDWRHKH